MLKYFLPVVMVVVLNACTPKLVEQLPYYKMPVVQGMPFDGNSIRALRQGMTKEQVQLEIGTPTLRPSFRENRWDYVYQVVRGGQIKESLHLAVFFDQNNRVRELSGSALTQAHHQQQ